MKRPWSIGAAMLVFWFILLFYYYYYYSSSCKLLKVFTQEARMKKRVFSGGRVETRVACYSHHNISSDPGEGEQDSVNENFKVGFEKDKGRGDQTQNSDNLSIKDLIIFNYCDHSLIFVRIFLKIIRRSCLGGRIKGIQQ